MAVTMDSNRPTVVGNVIMISGDIDQNSLGSTFDASPYMNEIINAHVLSAGQLNIHISDNDAPTDADSAHTVNLPALSCTFSGTTLSITSRSQVTGLDDEEGELPAFFMNDLAKVSMQDGAVLASSGKFLIIGRK